MISASCRKAIAGILTSEGFALTGHDSAPMDLAPDPERHVPALSPTEHVPAMLPIDARIKGAKRACPSPWAPAA